MTGREGTADFAVAEAVHVLQRGRFRVAQTVNLDETTSSTMSQIGHE
jgi:hypothetical protein